LGAGTGGAVKDMLLIPLVLVAVVILSGILTIVIMLI
jgi:hypothetical protein